MSVVLQLLKEIHKILSCARLQAEHPKVNMRFQSLLAVARGQGSVWLSPAKVHRVLA